MMERTTPQTHNSPAVFDWLPYPQGLLRYLMRLPIYLYRMGLGGLLDQFNILVLGTWGRRSGLARYTAIEYRAHGSKVYLISAWGERPNWFRNLRTYPVVRVCRGWRSYSARAEEVNNAGEALRVLHLFRKRAPGIYDLILARMSQQESVKARNLPQISELITIVRLDPVADKVGPPPLRLDLTWLWPLLGISFLLLLIKWLTGVRKT